MKETSIEIEYRNGFNEIDNHEMPSKGYRNDITVKCPTGKKYNLSFYDPIRLNQDIEEEEYIFEQNLIVIKNLTKDDIQNAVNRMWEIGFFDKLKEV